MEFSWLISMSISFFDQDEFFPTIVVMLVDCWLLVFENQAEEEKGQRTGV